jgi:hypothetical protein
MIIVVLSALPASRGNSLFARQGDCQGAEISFSLELRQPPQS